eukprot:4832506-Amphidinium_carterae.1
MECVRWRGYPFIMMSPLFAWFPTTERFTTLTCSQSSCVSACVSGTQSNYARRGILAISFQGLSSSQQHHTKMYHDSQQKHMKRQTHFNAKCKFCRLVICKTTATLHSVTVIESCIRM